MVSKTLRSVVQHFFGDKRAASVSSVFRFAAYALLVIVILGLAGVSGNALLAGGTFAGLVVGLAGQTVLSNVFAGLLIILARPFQPGDRVTLLTSQYGVIVPSYPPKYLSDDYLVPGYKGVISDIGLTYSMIKLDSGAPMKIPNNILIQAAVILRSYGNRRIKTRYFVQAGIDVLEMMNAIKDAIKENEWVVDKESVQVYVENITVDGVLISIEALCKGDLEEQPRSSILIDAMKVTASLKAKT